MLWNMSLTEYGLTINTELKNKQSLKTSQLIFRDKQPCLQKYVTEIQNKLKSNIAPNMAA